MLLNAAYLARTPEEPEDHWAPPLTVHDSRRKTVLAHLDRLRDQSLRLRYRRNETICIEHDSAQYVYSVLGGCVRLCRHVPDGRRHIPDFMFAGDIFGLGDFREYPYSAEAVNMVTLLAYPRSAFDRLSEDDCQLRTELMAHFSSLLSKAHRHLFMASCQNARERLASFIVQMSEKSQLVYGDRVDVPMGRQEIADHLGLTIETICRALAVFRDGGVLEVPNAHQFVVKKPDYLRALAEGTVAH